MALLSPVNVSSVREKICRLLLPKFRSGNTETVKFVRERKSVACKSKRTRVCHVNSDV